MFIKVTRSGPRRYVQLVEAYRDAGGRPKQRTVATLGRLDQMDARLESVIAGLLRLNGRAPAPAPPVPPVTFESACRVASRKVVTGCLTSDVTGPPRVAA